MLSSSVLSSLAKLRSAVSEKKSKMFQPIRRKDGHLVFLIGPKTQTWKWTLRSCFRSSFVEFRSAATEKKSKMSQPISSQGGHLVFPISLKKKLDRGRRDLASCQVSSNSAHRFLRRNRNVSASQRPWQPSYFPISLKNTSFIEDVAFCQVSLNSVQRFQRRSRKCFNQSEARAAILFLRSARKHKLHSGR